MKSKYKVWTCKIVVSADSELPSGFDSPPRMAAEDAIADAGFEVLMNSSGWGGTLDKHEIEAVESLQRQDVYVAGCLDKKGRLQ